MFDSLTEDLIVYSNLSSSVVEIYSIGYLAFKNNLNSLVKFIKSIVYKERSVLLSISKIYVFKI